ncbi:MULTISPECIES: tetratricopeptide repeat protein [Streptomyces]|uniref:tetratricopeptide repeat protein n=1 Tax=Streptomyces TaxID=1883 RepID=UPI000A71B7F8|nr:tetratricopeptide repeat protein [Streptomyces virginiae]
MAGGGVAVLCQVLSGTGGVGKTQLAAHHARTAWQAGAVDLLVWVTASSRDAVLSAYSEAAVTVTNPDDPRRAGLDDPERAAVRFLAWAQSTDLRWLIVLDDVSDPAHLNGTDGRSDLWPPARLHGRTVVTTRRRDAALPGHLIDVGLFTKGEAVGYLRAKLAAQGRHDDAGQVKELARDLGHLPLALAQAVTYLLDLHLDCATYRARLADRARTLPDLVPEASGLPDAHRATVAATWSLSIEHADRLRPMGLARPMLHLVALLDPNGIPATVLTSPPALAYLTEHRTPDGDTDPDVSRRAVGVDDAADVLRCLHRLSLADHTSNTPHQEVRVHNLIQRATREALRPAARDIAARACADALHEAWPEVERDTALGQTLRANTTALTAHAADALWQPDAHPVLFRIGNSLGQTGLVTAARAYFQDLHTAARQNLGPDHPATLTARHDMAYWRGAAGDAAGAATAFAELLADRLRVLGPDHPATLGTRHDLALWRGSRAAADVAWAATAFAELLADQLRVLGPDHPDTLITRHDLAHWRGAAGDAAGAATATAELLADQLRVLGPDHPATLLARHNLAHWRGEAGDAAWAATAFAELLADCLRVLGPDHPNTLLARQNLARWRGEVGDAAWAATAFAELLADRLRVLGPDHPDTLITRDYLAHWREQAGGASGDVR